jgi:acetyltransferase-like isoleucine patch superfamily enzyme
MRALSLSATAGRTALRWRHFRPWHAALRLELADAHVEGYVWLPGSGRVRIGSGVRLLARQADIELRAHAGAEIIIEDGVLIEDGASIEATESVRIGAGARIGAFCKIIDNQFHATVGNRFSRPTSVPIIVGPAASVGARAVLLPGAELGAGAAVGPGSVVSFRLAPRAAFPGTMRATQTED